MDEINIPQVISTLKSDLAGLHRFNPNYVFLTDASAVPAGYALKEAWKTAYPKEKVPIFYRIDPAALKEGLNHNFKKDINDFFKKRLGKNNARVFIYDEHSLHGGSPRTVLEILKFPERFGLDPSIKCEDIKMIKPRFVGDLSKKEIYESQQIPDIRGSQELYTLARSGANPIKKGPWMPYTEWKGYGMRGMPPQWNLRGKLISEEKWNQTNKGEYLPQELKNSTRSGAIRYFKQLGKSAGLQIKEENQHRNNLENKVLPAIAVGGLLASIGLSSITINGNAIANISVNIPPMVSPLLFLVGVLVSFVLLRNKQHSERLKNRKTHHST